VTHAVGGDRVLVLANVPQPVHNVSAAVEASAARRVAGNQMNLAAREMQVLGDLRAGLARAHDDDFAWG